MHMFIVEGAYQPPELDRVTSLCFLAREVLGGHMDNGFDRPDSEVADDGSEPEDFGLTVHDTSLVPISRSRHATLSNMPFLLDTDNNLVPFTEPGYVALRSEVMGGEPDDRVLQRNGQTGQLIFQIPQPAVQSAAIFHGFEMDQANQIALHDKRKLQRVEQVLLCVQLGLRHLGITDPRVYAESYHATRPRVSTGDAIDQQFAEWFGDS